MANTDNGGKRGQRILPEESLGLMPLSEAIKSVVGATATVLAKPAGAKQLFMFADKNGWRVRLGAFKSQTFTANATTDQLAITAHGIESGAGPFYVSNSGGALPAGLSASTPYYAVVNDTLGVNAIQLATSKANALAGTVVNITDTGSGTHTIFGMPAAEFPSSSEADGQGAIYLGQGDSWGMTAPENVTVKGYDSASVLTYFWI